MKMQLTATSEVFYNPARGINYTEVGVKGMSQIILVMIQGENSQVQIQDSEGGLLATVELMLGEDELSIKTISKKEPVASYIVVKRT